MFTGEVYTAPPTVAVRRLEGVAAGVRHGLASRAGESRTLWAAAHGSRGRIREDAARGTAASSFQLNGVTVGADLVRGASGQAGVLAGFHAETLDMPARWSALHGTGLQLGVYGRWQLGQVSLTGVAAVSRTHNEGQRRLAYDAGKTTLAAFDTTDTMMAVEARFAE